MGFTSRTEFSQLPRRQEQKVGWSTILKFHNTVLKKRPLFNQSLPDAQTPDSLGSWVEAQLHFLRDIVQPVIGATASGNRRPKHVGRDKLAYLWQNRKSKEIQIILNNNVNPDTPISLNNVQFVQNDCNPKSELYIRGQNVH